MDYWRTADQSQEETSLMTDLDTVQLTICIISGRGEEKIRDDFRLHQG